MCTAKPQCLKPCRASLSQVQKQLIQQSFQHKMAFMSMITYQYRIKDSQHRTHLTRLSWGGE
jgi:hypothetical protein